MSIFGIKVPTYANSNMYAMHSLLLIALLAFVVLTNLNINNRPAGSYLFQLIVNNKWYDIRNNIEELKDTLNGNRWTENQEHCIGRQLIAIVDW